MMSAQGPLTWSLGPSVMDIGPPYTRAELEVAGERAPDRGLYCPKCGTLIPQFAELSDSDAHRVRTLIMKGQQSLAMKELSSATGCPILWAKVWVTHSGKPCLVYPGPPCPRCGQPTRTARAKQCPHCF